MTAQGQFTLVRAGPQTLLQDLGRQHLQHIGFCQSGAADEHSFLWANKLLGNHSNDAALEITFGPFEAVFDRETRIAICGACSYFYLNRKKQPGWCALSVKPGDRIRIEGFSSGMHTYLAIKDGFLYESPFDSAAMSPREKSGPFTGKPLQSGMQLSYFTHETETISASYYVPFRFIPDYSRELCVNIIVHPDISKSILDSILKTELKVHQDSNRMAYRLVPEQNLLSESAAFRSKGTPFGTVQLTPKGDLLVLMKDRQTMGGYPVVGCVTHLDSFLLSQTRAGQPIRFSTISLEGAQKNLARFYRFFLG